MANDREVLFEDAEILFQNFSGVEKRYNAKGERNFCLKLPDDIADELASKQWNIKFLKPRDEQEQPQPYVEVKVAYDKGRPPKVVLITSNGQTHLDETSVGLLDWAEIKKTDLILNAYHWGPLADGSTGVKAYLKSLYVTLNEDELDLKYSDVPFADNKPAMAFEDPGQTPWGDE